MAFIASLSLLFSAISSAFSNASRDCDNSPSRSERLGISNYPEKPTNPPNSPFVYPTKTWALSAHNASCKSSALNMDLSPCSKSNPASPNSKFILRQPREGSWHCVNFTTVQQEPYGLTYTPRFLYANSSTPTDRSSPQVFSLNCKENTEYK